MQRHMVTPFTSLVGALALLSVLAAGCNGGSASAPPFNTGLTATPSPSPVPLPAAAATALPVGTTAATTSLGPVLGGFTAAITMPAASTPATLALTLGATQPAGTPAVQTVKRRTQTIGGTGISPVMFLTMTSTVAVTFGATPTISFVLPAGAASLGQISYVALYDPTAVPQLGWTTIEGPGVTSGNTITFTGSSANLRLAAGATYDLVLFAVPSALPTPTTIPTATPAPTPSPTATPTQSASAQHLYTAAGVGNSPVIEEFALPITSSSTPIVTVPAPVGSGGGLGSFLAVNANYVVYTDTVNREYFALNQPISASSTPSAAFAGIVGCCNITYLMPIALAPAGELAGTVSTGPTSGQTVNFFATPFSNQTVADPSPLQLFTPGAGLAFDSVGHLFVGGGITPTSGTIERYTGNHLDVQLKVNIFVTGIAVNANQLAVAATGSSSTSTEVMIYNLPLTSTSVPVVTITNGVVGQFVALDGAGNLYVSGTGLGLLVYAAPLSNASSPTTFSTIAPYGQAVIGP